MLSPFSVAVDKDQGYNSANTVGAARINVAIKNTPLSVVVLNNQFLTDIGATEPYQAGRYVAGVAAASSRGSGQMTLRGQNIPGATFRDGVPDAIAVDGNSFVDLALTERLEFIKGPAGTLYGSHNSGGIVNNVTKMPQAQPFSRMKLTVGEDNLKRVDLDSTGPLNGSETLTYRAIVAKEDGKTPRGTVNNSSVLGLQAGFAFTDGSLTARYSYLNVERDTNAYPWFTDAAGTISTFLPRDLTLTEKDQVRDYEQNLLDIDADKKFTTGPVEWTSRLKLRYSKVDTFNRLYQFDAAQFEAYDAAGVKIGDMSNILFSDPRISGLVVPSRVVFIRPSWNEVATANLDLVGNFTTGVSSHKLLLYGVYGQNWFRTLGEVASYPGIDVYNPVYHASPLLVQGPARPNQNQVIFGDSYAFAVQDNISFLNERLIVVLGVRYDKATTTNLNRINNVRVYDDVRTGTSRRAGLVVRPIEPLAFYANYSETFNPNGFDNLTGAQLPNQVPTNKEVGVKLNMFNDRLVVNYAYFDTKTTGALVAVTVLVDGVPRATNIPAGSLVVKGWEADAAWAVNRNLSIIGGIGNLDSKTTTGRRARSVPQGLNYKVFAKYTFTDTALKGVFIGLGYERNSERAGDGADTLTLPGYSLTNLLVGFSRGAWLFQANVENVFDESYASMAVARPIVYAGDPRRVQLSASYTW